MSTSEQQRQRQQDGTSYMIDPEQLAHEVQEIKVNQAVQQATLAGAQATQSAVQAGQTATMMASGTGILAGLIIGLLIANLHQR